MKIIEYLIKVIRFLSLQRITAFIILFIFFYLPVGVILGEFSMPVPYFLRKATEIGIAQAAISEAKSPGTDTHGLEAGSCGDNWNWTLGGLAAEDTTFTEYSGNQWDIGGTSDPLEAHNFGFALTNVDAILGITVEVIGWTSANVGAYQTVQLFTAPAALVGDNNAAGNLPEADPGTTYTSFGGADQLWNAGLSSAQIKNSTFGVQFCWTASADNSALHIDHVRITIEFTQVVAVNTCTQNNFRFYLDNDALTPTEPWGDPDIAEMGVLAVLPISNDAPASGSEMRLRLNIAVTEAELTATTKAFRLKYVAGDDCPDIASTSYSDVGASTSDEIWRFGEGWSDGATLFPFVLSDSDVTASGAYVESNPSTTNPVAVQIGENMEWDFSLQNNGAPAATKYCFRLQHSDDTDLEGYNEDSFPAIETAPVTADLMRHGNFFASEAEKGFFWAD